MKRKILIAAAVAALVAPLSPAAFARDDYDRDYRGGDRDYRGSGGYRDDAGYGRDDRHGHRPAVYVVHYHLDGSRGRVRVKTGDRAERVVDLLRSVGADAHIDGDRVVHFRMRGTGRIVRRSHDDAHRLAQKLEGYGFHAHVDHE